MTSYVITGLTTGTSYKFAVRARNIYGYGPFTTPDVAIVAASVPGTMSPVTTALSTSTTDIEISWSPAAPNGEAITRYQIQLFVPSTLSYVDDLTYCLGTNPALTICTFPISYLISTYSFQRGDLVQARVRAQNSINFGGYSSLNTVGATVQTVPATMNAPTKVATSTATRLDIAWSALTTNLETGASPITSYHIQWD